MASTSIMPSRLIAFALAVMVVSPLCACCLPPPAQASDASAHACCHAGNGAEPGKDRKEQPPCSHCHEKRIVADARVEAPPLLVAPLPVMLHAFVEAPAFLPMTEARLCTLLDDRPPPRGLPLFVSYCALLL